MPGKRRPLTAKTALSLTGQRRLAGQTGSACNSPGSVLGWKLNRKCGDPFMLQTAT